MTTLTPDRTIAPAALEPVPVTHLKHHCESTPIAAWPPGTLYDVYHILRGKERGCEEEA